jgi:hypothetical protein
MTPKKNSRAGCQASAKGNLPVRANSTLANQSICENRVLIRTMAIYKDATERPLMGDFAG